MDIRSLEIFVAVAELGSASKAAEALHMTQPAISWAINKMEQYYGVRFFEHSTRRMQLNQAGSAILPQAREVLRQFSRFDGLARQFQTSHTLTVGYSFGQDLMQSSCRETLAQVYPELELCIVYGNSAKIRSSLVDGSVDLGIFALSQDCPELCTVPLWEDELQFICSADNPLLRQPHMTFAELLQFPAYLREQGHSARDCFDALCRKAGVQVTPLWQGAYNKLLIDSMVRGSGFSLLSASDLEGFQEENLSTIALEDVHPTQTVVLAYRKSRILSPSDRYLIKICQEYCSTHKSHL